LRGSVLGVCACLMLAACEPPTDPIDPGSRQLLVQAVLDAASEQQTVTLAWTESTDFGSTRPVSGAFVRVETPHGFYVDGVEDIDPSRPGDIEPGSYRVNLAGIFLAPGATYTLRVILQTGEVVTGTTTIPNVSRTQSVELIPTFVRARDTLKVELPRAPGVKGHQVAIRSEFTQGGETFSFDTYLAFVDTSVTIAGTARTMENNEVFHEGSSATVVVVAVDDNYYNYYHPTVDPFAGAPPSRLTGALGFFGSVVPVRALRIGQVR
jgi:hypothetical protein